MQGKCFYLVPLIHIQCSLKVPRIRWHQTQNDSPHTLYPVLLVGSLGSLLSHPDTHALTSVGQTRLWHA